MSPSEPEVSVIMPAYNARRTIKAAVESVRRQTFTDWELVIVDDCSSDGTRDLLKDAASADPRLRLFFSDRNRGAAHARNTALDLASGRYVAFLDSDDRWKPEKLQKQLQFMKMHRYAFTFTGYEYMRADGTIVGKYIRAPRRVGYRDMLKNTIVGCLTVMIDRELTGPLHMPDLRSRQDLATWLALLKRGFIAYGLNENLAEYRLSGQQSVSGNKWNSARKTWYVYRRIEHLPFIPSCWYFFHYAANAVRKRL